MPLPVTMLLPPQTLSFALLIRHYAAQRARGLWPWLALLACLSLTNSALAQQTQVFAAVAPAPAYSDEVVLKDGGLVRGTIAEYEPGKSVTLLVLGSGERRVFTWDQVERVNRNVQAAQSSEAGPPDAPQATQLSNLPVSLRVLVNGKVVTPEPLRLGEPGVVKLHIEADDRHVELRRIVGTQLSGFSVVGNSVSPTYATVYETVCTAPCDQLIDGSDDSQYAFGGRGLATSRKFRLSERRGELTAHVQAARWRKRVAGIYTTVFGAVMLPAAGSAVLTSASLTDSRPITIAFGSIAGVGLVSLTTGAIMLLKHRTRYELRP